MKYKKETMIVDEFILPPIQENTKIFYSHFGRYFYASKMLNIRNSDIVIDASCGNGYGSFSLSSQAKYVFGLDVNKDYIKMAVNNYDADNITFTTYDDFYKNFGDIWANKILCIETYEHVPKDEIDEFINKLLSKLKTGGDMFVTVPLGNNEPNPINKWHLNEPSIDVIYNMFSNYFKTINIEIDTFVNCFGQECQYCYLILKNKI